MKVEKISVANLPEKVVKGRTERKLNKVFDIEETKKETKTAIEKVENSLKALKKFERKELPLEDLAKDYDETRKVYKDLVKKGKKALDGILEIAEESEQPRAYEVFADLMKNLGEVTEKMVDTHGKIKDIIREENERAPISTVNADKAVFIGSTSDLLDEIDKATED